MFDTVQTKGPPGAYKQSGGCCEARAHMGMEGEIRRCSGYVAIDIRGREAGEVGEVYREFAALCIEQDIRRAVVRAGDDDPGVHYGLRDAFTTMILTVGVPRDFTLALVPETPQVERVYQLILSDFKALGIKAAIFKAHDAAIAWIEKADSR